MVWVKAFRCLGQLGTWIHNQKLHLSLFVRLCFGFIGMDHVISELCYKGTILQRNYRKEKTISWSVSYNSFVKIYVKNLGAML